MQNQVDGILIPTMIHSQEEIDKFLEAKFIYEIKHTDWVSPIMVVPKKNGKL